MIEKLNIREQVQKEYNNYFRPDNELTYVMVGTLQVIENKINEIIEVQNGKEK